MDQWGALARGITRWRDFVEACMKQGGPAGVVRRGRSKRALDLRAEVSSWNPESETNAFDLVIPLTMSRLDLAGQHAAGVVRLIEREPMPIAASILSRTWLEAVGRALWLLDPSLSARQIIRRGLTEWLEEGRQLKRLRVSTRALKPTGSQAPAKQSIESIVMDVADMAGLEVDRDERTGKIKGIDGCSRPNTFDLLNAYDRAPTPLFPRLAQGMYRRSSAAAHSNFIAWGYMVGMNDKNGRPSMSFASTFAIDLLTTVELHARALRGWNSLIDWSPQDMMENAERASLAPLMLAIMEVTRDGAE